MKQTRFYSQAFTLVELSIVLVIVGLLVGGILTGQSLIHAAELRSISSQYSKYIAAVQTFHDKYGALPGDLPSAQGYWGVAHATPSTCITTASSDSKTCNGDGNNKIDYSAGSNEYFRFWQHLANAGLLEGSYDGITHGGSIVSATVANSPTGRFKNTLWFVANWGAITGGGAALFDGQYNNSLEIGGITANNDPYTPFLIPEDVYNIDKKIDDGKPATGSMVVRAFYGFNYCTDTSSSSNMNASYLLNSSMVACTIMFRDLF